MRGRERERKRPIANEVVIVSLALISISPGIGGGNLSEAGSKKEAHKKLCGSETC